MKFVYFGYDFMVPSVRRLLSENHELLGIFSFETDNVFNFNTQTHALATQTNTPFILSKPEDTHLQSFLEKGCALFLSAGYPHKIPPVDFTRAYAVNVHPTYLPHGRGLMPIPHIIMHHIDKAAGFSAHKMTPHFDAGDILLQQKFDLSPRETVETYCAKISMRAPEMLSKLVQSLPALWDSAAPQNPQHASHFPAPSETDRLLDWSRTPDDLDRIARAFGRFGCLAQTPEGLFVAYDVSCWDETHDTPPGAIVCRSARDMTLACSGGYVCLKEFYSATNANN